MTKNWEDYLTDIGKTKFEFFSKQHLGRYYDPMMGNLQIDENEWETVKNDVLAFIEEYWHEQWVLSYNKQCGMWFVFQTED